MARLPTIAARAPPQRKTSSSHTSSSAATSAIATTSQASQVTKAAKRSAKRAKLLASSSSSHNPSADVLGLPASAISKSAQRRRKRKARDEVVLGQGGLEEIKDELEDLASSDDEEGKEGAEDMAPRTTEMTILVDQQSSNSNGITPQMRSGKVGSKLRKRVLAQESMRQPFILKDLYASDQLRYGASTSASSAETFASASPFAAIRRHAQNSFGLTANATAQRDRRDDVLMR